MSPVLEKLITHSSLFDGTFPEVAVTTICNQPVLSVTAPLTVKIEYVAS